MFIFILHLCMPSVLENVRHFTIQSLHRKYSLSHYPCHKFPKLFMHRALAPLDACSGKSWCASISNMITATVGFFTGLGAVSRGSIHKKYPNPRLYNEMKKKSSQFREYLFGSQEPFIKPVFFSGLFSLLLHLHFNHII